MDTNKMREQFEAWARSKGLDLEYRNFPGIGQFYECPRTLLALEAWQASRESVVVELPDVAHEIDESIEIAYGFNCALKTIRADIEAQGLKVAP